MYILSLIYFLECENISPVTTTKELAPDPNIEDKFLPKYNFGKTKCKEKYDSRGGLELDGQAETGFNNKNRIQNRNPVCILTMVLRL